MRFSLGSYLTLALSIGAISNRAVANAAPALRCTGVERSNGYEPWSYGIHVHQQADEDWIATIGTTKLRCGKDVDLLNDSSFSCGNQERYLWFSRNAEHGTWGRFGGYNGPYGEEPSTLASIEDCTLQN